MADAFTEYYRCPVDLATVKTAGPLSGGERRFRFEASADAGRSTESRPSPRVNEIAHIVSPEQFLEDGANHLPFDLSEMVANLRQERYVSNGRATGAAELTRTLYYAARPLFGLSVRKHLQRFRLRDWQQIPFPRWPVDFSVDKLMEAAMTLTLRSGVARVPFIWFWPDGAQSCAILTHDIETTSGRDFCGRLMDIDEEYGFKASFQVVPEQRYDGVEALCASIRDRGFEVNVHDLNHDGHLFESRQQFEERVKRVNEYGRAFHSRGFRTAAMYRNQSWFDMLEFSYDMSVPNVAHLEPQRGGCCTVMPYFVGGLVELPLTTIQDYSLFHILGQYSTTLWDEQIQRIVAGHGLITLLSHPDYLIEARAQATYRELLRKVAGLRAAGQLWFGLPGEVERWWRARNELQLVPAGDSWRVEGTGAERARVAYAMLEDGRLIYTM
jgi:hypothetical protein